MQSFIEHYKKKSLNKKLIETYGKYQVYLVNGEAVRNTSQAMEEFGGSGNHYFYDFIPENEIWIEDNVREKERDILIARELYSIKLIEGGMSQPKAYAKATDKEKDYRESLKLSKQSPEKTDKRAPDSVYVDEYGKIESEGLTVWTVDGEVVRNKYKTDFIEGGHGYVYAWVPNDEIWLEFGIDKKEMPLLILHEFVEYIIMKYDKMKYDDAHKIAAKVEFKHRDDGFSKEDVLAMTKEKALEMVEKSH